jgi:hypothetical protein
MAISVFVAIVTACSCIPVGAGRVSSVGCDHCGESGEQAELQIDDGGNKFHVSIILCLSGMSKGGKENRTLQQYCNINIANKHYQFLFSCVLIENQYQ